MKEVRDIAIASLEEIKQYQSIGTVEELQKVDKEELLKALQYDREQYYRGYNDAVDEFAERLKIHLGELNCEAFLSDIRHIADIMKV